MSAVLFHIATITEWSPDHACYTPARYVEDGFIHCSTLEQVVRVANERFLGRKDLLLLRIDPDRVHSPIRYENLEDGSEMFPHIYGPIETSAIVLVVPFTPREDGHFELPDLAANVA